MRIVERVRNSISIFILIGIFKFKQPLAPVAEISPVVLQSPCEKHEPANPEQTEAVIGPSQQDEHSCHEDPAQSIEVEPCSSDFRFSKCEESQRQAEAVECEFRVVQPHESEVDVAAKDRDDGEHEDFEVVDEKAADSDQRGGQRSVEGRAVRQVDHQRVEVQFLQPPVTREQVADQEC